MPSTHAQEISYAMRNAEATQRLVSFNAPWRLLDFSHFVIECVMIAGAILGLVHAIRTSRKTGSPSALLAFAGIFLYGLVMDITSYYTVENFWHGEFTVMFLFNRLPLYITALYPALLYHSYMTIRRYDFSPLLEATVVGFYAGVLYLIFDNVGPALGWWVWDRESPFSQPLLDAVPLTSYHWLFLFSAALAYVVRKFCFDAVARGELRKARIGTALLPITTILVGTVIFLPYHGFMWLGRALFGSVGLAALWHAALFGGAGFLFLHAWRKQQEERDFLLLFFPLVWVVAHLFLLIAHDDAMWSPHHDGLNAHGLAVGNTWAIGSAMIVGAAMTIASHVKSARA